MTPAHPRTTPSAASIEAMLRAALAPRQLEVIDESAAHAGHMAASPSGGGTHFRVRIAADRLDGLSRLAAHRVVYDVLRPAFDAGLHALALEIERHPSSSMA
ncbi:DNA-binding transcriptional regulator BolA [Tepidimonas alkaliphilus]|uniref:DNA-binding transcriptional regulator BolA n=1 Tax=Tepidimonas alkaliphilus TaxID=2588942 RepID=A0A554WA58_9BURK|nr:BolA family protein [Tepidimonas alkaliphilus]TSE20461.1 DNA-binding transcriptional regulator BolA [Tepidimonas alkaliphilus]